MAYRSLILGMVFTIGIFAAKGGMGMAFATMGLRVRSKAMAISAYALAYGLIFLGAALLLRYLDMADHLNVIREFLQSGMLIHGIMAALMMVWGLGLLKKRKTPPRHSRGWLLLVVPCPVCAASILFSAAFFLSVFPDHPGGTLAGLYLIFLLISIIAMVLIHTFTAKTQPDAVRSPASLLGGTMLLIASYFLVSVTVMPHVGDLDSVYRLACYRSSTAALTDRVSSFAAAMVVASAFAWGWGSTYFNTRRCS